MQLLAALVLVLAIHFHASEAQTVIGKVVHTAAQQTGDPGDGVPIVGRVIHVADQPQPPQALGEVARGKVEPPRPSNPVLEPTAQSLSGQWYEIARSKKAAETAQRGCACNLAHFASLAPPQKSAPKAVVEGPAGLMGHFVCRNTSLGADGLAEDKWISAEVSMRAEKQGQYRAHMVAGPKGAGKAHRKVLLLAAGPEFSAWLDADRGIAHILSRKPVMEAELLAGLSELFADAGINPADLVRVNHETALCGEFHKRAALRLATPRRTAAIEQAPTQGLPPQAEAKAGPAANEPSPPPLDAKLFDGLFYEIAASKAAIDTVERGCKCAQKHFKAADANNLDLHIACLNATDGQTLLARGRSVQDKQSPGLFRVSVDELLPYGLKAPAAHEKVVIAVGKDATSYIVGEPAINAIWIYARQPAIDDALYQRLIALIEAIGFNKSDLVKSDQKHAQCPAVTARLREYAALRASRQPV